MVISRDGVSIGEDSTPPSMMRSTVVVSSISENASRSERHDHRSRAGAGGEGGRRGEHVVGLQARRNDDGDAELAQHVRGAAQLIDERVELVDAVGLVLRPGVAAAAGVGIVESDDDRRWADRSTAATSWDSSPRTAQVGRPSAEWIPVRACE